MASPSDPHPPLSSRDTIIASAAGPGLSHRALIRASGPAVPIIASSLLPSLPPAPDTGGACAHRALLHLPGLEPFPTLALRFAPGRSFTSEDSLELLPPGNPVLIDRILRAMTALPGVREAQPGEFSARAFLAGRLSLDRAEGLAAVIAAASADELSAARCLLRGDTGRRFADWADRLATLLALVESGVDFTDQDDVVPIAPADLAARLDALDREMTSALGSRRGSESPSWQPAVVLLGAPSAGKSTLFNALLGRRRAVTSPTPGTTRDALREPLRLSPSDRAGSALEVDLIDLPGLDAPHAAPPADPLHALAQSAAAALLAHADLALWCDPDARFDPRDFPPLHADTRLLRVVTKADLVRPRAAPPTADPADAPIHVCALDAFGLDLLRHAILRAAWSARAPSPEGILLPRHRRALLRALHALSTARDTFNPLLHALDRPELVAHHLRDALDAAGELTGRIDPDQILGRVFSTFCIGK